ncbi:MAG: peptide chain release factor N(5)-glutamine methyltransferase [Anaerolineae bacterium]|nr:peptide chain release factor N(5)-glutamine methyltransferase [Anaerolineae bacterium]
MTKKIETWLEGACAKLQRVSEQPALEARVLVAHAIGQTQAWVIAHTEYELQPNQLIWLDETLEKLVQGVPLPYLTGHQEFYGLDFIVSPQVLIPRPETELLVETALTWLQTHPARRRTADVGTGSGCIAISLAKHTPDLLCIASDISRSALQIAACNAARHNIGKNLLLLQTDLLLAVDTQFDLVCANLPYIPAADLTYLEVSRHEPAVALNGGADGLSFIRRLMADACRWLAPGGTLLIEIEARQEQSATAIARHLFPHAEINVWHDLAGHARLLQLENC